MGVSKWCLCGKSQMGGELTFPVFHSLLDYMSPVGGQFL